MSDPSIWKQTVKQASCGTSRKRLLNLSTGISPVCSESKAANPLLSPSSLQVKGETWKLFLKSWTKNSFVTLWSFFSFRWPIPMIGTGIIIIPLFLSGLPKLSCHVCHKFFMVDETIAVPARYWTPFIFKIWPVQYPYEVPKLLLDVIKYVNNLLYFCKPLSSVFFHLLEPLYSFQRFGTFVLCTFINLSIVKIENFTFVYHCTV